jgi:hypothetical protein
LFKKRGKLGTKFYFVEKLGQDLIAAPKKRGRPQVRVPQEHKLVKDATVTISRVCHVCYEIGPHPVNGKKGGRKSYKGMKYTKDKCMKCNRLICKRCEENKVWNHQLGKVNPFPAGYMNWWEYFNGNPIADADAHHNASDDDVHDDDQAQESHDDAEQGGDDDQQVHDDDDDDDDAYDDQDDEHEDQSLYFERTARFFDDEGDDDVAGFFSSEDDEHDEHDDDDDDDS